MASTPTKPRRVSSLQPDGYIGSFKKGETIGRGSFAVVHKAIHPDDNSFVAIKTIHHAALKGKLMKNLKSEIKIMKTVTHPHIVALLDIIETSNDIHLVMEFCQFGDLSSLVRKRDSLSVHPVTADMIKRYPNHPDGGFNEVVVRHFAQQTASALAFLHDKNIIHRDLKPQNLLLNPPASWLANEPPENQPYRATKDPIKPLAGLDSLPFLKIADFGFARHLPTTTMAETLCGSPLYMAPEILRYEKYDAKADLWSVGAILYELMIGRPPFRAANHVDLLRRIDKTADRIKLPAELRISDDMHKIIRGLLKRIPVERMSWDDFFKSPVITDEIPGLVGPDRKPSNLTSGSKLKREEKQGESSTKVAGDAAEKRSGSKDGTDARPTPDRTSSGPPPRSSPKLRHASVATSHQQRPELFSHVTSPAVQGIRNERPAGPTTMERRKSERPSTGTSDPQGKHQVERKPSDRMIREARERVGTDVSFERDYVIVEKRAVEVNAFADELAASPQIHAGRAEPSSAPGVIVRRPTTRESKDSAAKDNQVALRPDHQRKNSYERTYGVNRTSSATSALAAALNMVNFRFGGGGPLSFAPGKSPLPQGYGPYPAFPTTHAGPLLLGDSPKATRMDEDQKALSTLEESATRSDVVYGFGEVKFKQLIPISPSNDDPLGIHRPVPPVETGFEDDGLTVDAIVSISEEALVLYVKALAILSSTINLAGAWWAIKNKGEVLGEVNSLSRPLENGKPSPAAIGNRINNVVQWARSRFNECLEKSEFVSRKLVEAQKRLPIDNPGHPSNIRKPNEKSQRNEVADSEINLTSGITAEKLMYERALEMSKTAAVAELVGEDLGGCELSYLTSIRLLEAVLHEDDGADMKTVTASEKDKRSKISKGNLEGMEDADRKTVIKLIESIRIRLTTLRKKIAVQNAANRNSLKSYSSGRDSNSSQSYTSATAGSGRTPP